MTEHIASRLRHRDGRSRLERGTRSRTMQGGRTVVALVAAILAALAIARPASARQEDDGFVTLFDGAGLDGWVVENTEAGNIAVRDSVIVVAEPGGWLRSAEQYANFRLALEFRLATDGADSGLFLRAATTGGFGRGWPNRSYQIQLRDMHQPSRVLPLGEIYRHGMPQGDVEYNAAVVDARYRGAGEWHELEVEVVGDVLTVWLGGEVITRAQGIANPVGYIGFQAESGSVEYRNVRIRRLE
ncbi:MAG TPA: DUF1080 domain-containing protein [Longimicrobiales bacterium]|nr:DUF1080 domain-containing protein [Longimicrobiales bacterium]